MFFGAPDIVHADEKAFDPEEVIMGCLQQECFVPACVAAVEEEIIAVAELRVFGYGIRRTVPCKVSTFAGGIIREPKMTCD